MKSSEYTSIGGIGGSFQTTHWTEILSAQTLDPARRREVVGTIAGQYWKPVYAYLRRKGRDNEEAKDLTQGFFEEVILGRKLIQQADRGKGHFRTLLLAALDRYVTSVYRSETAKKRRPDGGLVRLGVVDGYEIPEPASRTTPDQAFVYAWASTLLDEVLDLVEDGCLQAGLDNHWEVFRRTVLEPTLTASKAPPLFQICTELGIENEAKASNMNITVKRRFKVALQERVRQFVDSDDEVKAEINELIEILSKDSAGT